MSLTRADEILHITIYLYPRGSQELHFQPYSKLLGFSLEVENMTSLHWFPRQSKSSKSRELCKILSIMEEAGKYLILDTECFYFAICFSSFFYFWPFTARII